MPPSSHQGRRSGPEAPKPPLTGTEPHKVSSAHDRARDGWPPGKAKGPVGWDPPGPTADSPPRSTAALVIVPDWRARGRRFCPRRRQWISAGIADASAELGSLKVVYAQLDAGRLEREAVTSALATRRKRDFEAGLYSLDGHLHQDAAFRAFMEERSGLRLPTPAEAAASWPEPEVR
jgi:hypothetical protein